MSNGYANAARERKAQAICRVLYALAESGRGDAAGVQKTIELARRMTAEQWQQAARIASARDGKKVNPPSRETIDKHIMPLLETDLRWATEAQHNWLTCDACLVRLLETAS